MFNQIVKTAVVACSLQVWVLGQSPEFGHCKATKKARFVLAVLHLALGCDLQAVRCIFLFPISLLSPEIHAPRFHAYVGIEMLTRHVRPCMLQNGEPCRMPVNAARCPFCPYHVQASMG